MDRTLAANYVTVGGKRVYQDLNLGAGLQGTALMAADRTATQEELISGFIEGTGIAPASGTLNQAAQGARRMAGANVTSVSAAGTTTLTADNAGIVLVNATAGAIVIDLPAVASANGVPLRMTFIRTDATANTVTFAPNGSDTFLSLAWGTVAAPSLSPGLPVDLRGDGVSHWIEMPAVMAIAGSQVFLASGSFTALNGVTNYRARVWGAGSGGDGAPGSAVSAGGSGGGYSEKILQLAPGTVVPVTVGTGGTGGAGTGAGGGAGGASSFGSFVSAGGGNRTYPGTGSGGTLNIAGDTGVGGFMTLGGVGGGAFGSSGTSNTTSVGLSGQFPGGGGSGAYNSNSGGPGGNGLVVVEW